MTVMTTYEHLQETITRVMRPGGALGITPATLEMPDGPVDVAAKLYMSGDIGWHLIYGIVHYENGAGPVTAFEEHSQAPLLQTSSPTKVDETNSHNCSPVGCSYLFAQDSNYFHADFDGNKTQAPDPELFGRVIGERLLPRLLSRHGLDIFSHPADTDSRTFSLLRTLRGPAENPHRLFNNSALARALDIWLRI